MCSSALFFGGIVLLACGLLVVSSKNTCDGTTDIQIVQHTCREYNDALLVAEQDKHYLELCRQVFLLLKCVVINVASCYDLFQNLNEMYFHSPYNCQMSHNEVLELQEIYVNKTQASVFSQSPSSSTEIEGATWPTSTPLTVLITNTEDEEKDGAGGRDQITRTAVKNKKGTKEEQMGTHNGASTIWKNTVSLTLLTLMAQVAILMS